MSPSSQDAPAPDGPPNAAFAPQEYAARRAKILDAIGAEAHALLQGAPPADAYDLFRQSNQFHYCCGVELPQAYLLLDGRSRRAALYLPAAQVDEAGDDARRRSGVDDVFSAANLAQHLQRARVLYTPHQPGEGAAQCRDVLRHAAALAASDPWDGALTREQRLIRLVRDRRPGLEIRDLSPILDEMRRVKSPRELARLRRAGALAALAVAEAIRATRPGVIEGQLAALASYVYRLAGARADAYRAIVPGGANAWDAHYIQNDEPLRDGDLVLMDTAPDYHYYVTDIGRMWPVNGTYSPPQRELYGFIVTYHKALLRRIRPGVKAEQILAEAAEEMTGVVERTAFSKDAYKAAAERTLTYRGHLSHPVGMAVHDAARYSAKPLEPGVVFAVDPQMWIPEDKRYVRVEDTVAVTEDGIENLTGAAPLEADEIEALMRDRPTRLPLIDEIAPRD